MRNIILPIIALAFAGLVHAQSLEKDISHDGPLAYFLAHITDRQFSVMIADYEVMTKADTLHYTECGKHVYLHSTDGFNVTLPAPIAGCHFTFWVKTQPGSNAYTVTTANGEDIIYGTMVINGSDIGCSAEDTITFSDGVALVGARANFDSDGDVWYLDADGDTTGSITCTAS